MKRLERFGLNFDENDYGYPDALTLYIQMRILCVQQDTEGDFFGVMNGDIIEGLPCYVVPYIRDQFPYEGPLWIARQPSKYISFASSEGDDNLPEVLVISDGAVYRVYAPTCNHADVTSRIERWCRKHDHVPSDEILDKFADEFVRVESIHIE